MKAKHRKILRRLMDYANALGGTLDGTSTNEAKYRDRQRAHKYTFDVLIAILGDNPDNDSTQHEFEIAEKSLKEMEALTKKSYPDRQGNY